MVTHHVPGVPAFGVAGRSSGETSRERKTKFVHELEARP
jgi:hypothetical protein